MIFSIYIQSRQQHKPIPRPPVCLCVGICFHFTNRSCSCLAACVQHKVNSSSNGKKYAYDYYSYGQYVIFRDQYGWVRSQLTGCVHGCIFILSCSFVLLLLSFVPACAAPWRAFLSGLLHVCPCYTSIWFNSLLASCAAVLYGPWLMILPCCLACMQWVHMQGGTTATATRLARCLAW